MKKVISLFLSLIMLFSSLAVADFSAFALDVTEEEPCYIYSASDGLYYYSFVPEKTGSYSVVTSNQKHILIPFICDNNRNPLEDEYYQKTKDFTNKPSLYNTTVRYHYFEAGKQYQIGIYKKYSSLGTGSFSSFTVKYHEHSFKYGICSCGFMDENYDFELHQAAVNERAVAEVLYNNENALFKFDCNENASYALTVTNPCGGKVDVLIFDSGKKLLKQYYSISNCVIYDFEKDKSYLIALSFSDNDFNGTLSLKITKHVHDFKTDSSKAPTCKRDGSFTYTCKTCGYTYTENILRSNKYHCFINGKCYYCGDSDPDYQRHYTSISLGEEVSGEITYLGEKNYYVFTPEESGWYQAEYVSSDDNITLRFDFFEGEDRLNSNQNYRYAELTAGREYILTVYFQDYYPSYNPLLGNYSFKIVPHEHDIISNTNKATCVEDGYTQYNCRYCQYRYKEVIPKSSEYHRYVNGTCKYCGDVIENYNPQANAILLTLGEKASYSDVEKGEEVYFTFTPETSDYYNFSSSLHSINYSVYGSDDSVVAENVNFASGVTYYLEAGEKYYIKSVALSYGAYIPLTVDVHVHSYYTNTKRATCVEDGSIYSRCTKCGYEKTEIIPATGEHKFVNGECSVCSLADENYVKTVTPISVGEEKEFSVTQPGKEKVYFEFTPDEDGIYTFTVKVDYSLSLGSYPVLTVDDSEGNTISKRSHGADIRNYLYNSYYDLEGGKTYEIAVMVMGKIENSEKTDSISVSKHEHNLVSNNPQLKCDAYVDETFCCSGIGCNEKYVVTHEPIGNHEFVENTVNPTCINSGYTEFKCKTCSIKYYCNYTPEDESAHSFKNGVCELCGVYEQEQEETLVFLYTPVSFTAKDENDIIVASFVPETTGFYYFRSVGSCDTQAEMYDSKGNFVAEDNNSGVNNNFKVSQRLKAGEKYYLEMKCLNADSNGERNFVLTVGEHTHNYKYSKSIINCKGKNCTVFYCECGDYHIGSVSVRDNEHKYKRKSYIDPTCQSKGYYICQCTVCGDTYIEEGNEVAQHSYINSVCEYCGKRSDRNFLVSEQELEEGVLSEEMDFSQTNTGGTVYSCYALMYFTPGENGTYLFETKGNAETWGGLFDSEGNLLTEDERSGIGDNCALAYELKAGERYTFRVENNIFKRCKARALVTKHTHNCVEYTVPASCEDEGYTICTCTDCYLSFKKDVVPAVGHSFSDGECTVCGAEDINIIFESSRSISLGETATVAAYENAVFKYTPEEDVTVSFTAESSYITVGAIVNESFDELPDYDLTQSGNGMNFSITAKLLKGSTYYLIANACPGDYTVELNRIHEHIFEEIETVEATCISSGYTLYRCNECGKEKKENKTAALGHDYVDSLTVEPTCTEMGYTVSKCTKCGDEIINKLTDARHTFNRWEWHNATCTEYGYTASVCTKCGFVEIWSDSTIEPTGHSYSVYKRIEPTCENDGKVIYRCRCGDSYEIGIESLGHQVIVQKPVKATYKHDGKTKGCYCCVCGKVFVKQKTIPKKVPPKPRITKLTPKHEDWERGIMINWKKQSKGVSGYVIEYSKSEDLDGRNTRTIIVKGRKRSKYLLWDLEPGTKYYIRIMSYKVVKNKRYYSEYSKVKSAKTKKK